MNIFNLLMYEHTLLYELYRLLVIILQPFFFFYFIINFYLYIYIYIKQALLVNQRINDLFIYIINIYIYIYIRSILYTIILI